MIRFHGIVLKMSIDDRKLGGYEAYFTEGMSINLGRNCSVTLTDYPAWAIKIMSLSRFKQIRAAYHPEVGSSTIGDKCHQLRYAIDTCNATSKTTFVVGPDLTFDDAGVASQSRMNPVRQYNKDKPTNFESTSLCQQTTHLENILLCTWIIGALINYQHVTIFVIFRYIMLITPVIFKFIWQRNIR